MSKQMNFYFIVLLLHESETKLSSSMNGVRLKKCRTGMMWRCIIFSDLVILQLGYIELKKNPTKAYSGLDGFWLS
jgi:hypothetical protein